jgi:hypothetical protein
MHFMKMYITSFFQTYIIKVSHELEQRLTALILGLLFFEKSLD